MPTPPSTEIASHNHRPWYRPTAVAWAKSDGLVPYTDAVQIMESRADAIAAGNATELVWLLEHPPLYTAGTSARASDLLDPNRFPVFQTGRGGQFTYHGPGQRVVYVMLNLNARKRDVRAFVTAIENWIIATLAHFDIQGVVHPDRVGVWVQHREAGVTREEKIAAIGLRLRKWVTLHGFAINVAPDLDHFSGIVPCGIASHGVTSFKVLGKETNLAKIDEILRRTFARDFGPTHNASICV